MNYQDEQRSGYRVYFEEQDRAEAGQACQALELGLGCIQRRWRLQPPSDLHMVMMTGWWSYILAAAPPAWIIYLILTYPLWAWRVRRTWKFVGGWQNRYGSRFVLGVKPPRLLAVADRSMGRRVYVDVPDLSEKMRHMIYHEVTHACAAHLRLPAWLNEGLAMLTVDGIVGWRTVQPGTVEMLNRGAAVTRGRHMARLDPDSVVALYTRGYWICRYYEETHPGLLGGLLQRPLGRRKIEALLAKALNLPPERFWTDIDRVVKGYFQANPPG